MFAIDNDHVITHWNKSHGRDVGIPADKVLGTQNQWMKFHKERRPTLADLVLNFLPEKMIEAQYEGDYRKNPHIEEAYDVSTFFPDLGDEGKWITFSAAPLKNEDGQVVGAVEVLQDFSQQKKQVRHFDIMKNIARQSGTR